MCETVSIRHEHSMAHPNYSGVLVCGCVCAGHMESNVVAAKGRETEMKNHTARRSRWLSRPWRCSKRGNEFIRVEGVCVTVFCGSDGWRYVVDSESRKLWGPCCLSSDAAKLSAFDALYPRPGQARR